MSLTTKLASLRRGERAEQLARRYLQRAGLSFITANYRKPGGEIDLIFKDQDVLVFVEVRSRRRAGFMHATETIDRHKQRKLLHCAAFYLQQHGNQYSGSRFDVVAITGEGKEATLEWIKDAFQA